MLCANFYVDFTIQHGTMMMSTLMVIVVDDDGDDPKRYYVIRSTSFVLRIVGGEWSLFYNTTDISVKKC